MRGESALDQREDVGAMKDVQLGGILLENLSEDELLDGASVVVGRLHSDFCWCSGERILDWRLDGDEAVV